VFQRHHNASSTVSTSSTASVQQLLISLLLLLSFSLSPFAQATAPVVSVTAPATNSKSIAPASITITATATNDATATISKVQFYRGTTLLGTSTTAPYSYTWTNVAAGSYNLTAKATNSLNQVTTSAVVAVVVNNLPTVSLTAPANNSSVAGKATVSLTATASDTGGSIAKVEFFNGSTLLGSDTTSPYSYSWTNVVPGTYSLTAKATDNRGDTKTTNITTFTVTNPLSTSLTAPANNNIATAGSAITVSANAATSKSGSTISKVEFYQGSTLIGSDTSSPYSISWTGAAIGTYSLTAKVTDSQGLTQTSSPISVQVKGATTPPTVSLTAPIANANFIAPASITLTSNPAATGAGNSISKVEYYQDTTLVASSTTMPFSATWTNAPAGSYSMTAKVTDSNGNSATSTPVAITIINNTAPTVSLTANPSNGTAPATIILNATASDTDGSIAKVELLDGSTVLKTFTTAQPTYNYLWENVPQGSYNLTAKATDNLGASTTSSVVPVSVTASVAKIYDIHTDHLRTPRMVTDASGNSVWEWIGTPFGESLPNQNPNNTGVQNDFVMNLRFPGQVFDKETGLHYNYFRDYDPSSGRYIESDPIGLSGGVNTFAYVENGPLRGTDPTGLTEWFGHLQCDGKGNYEIINNDKSKTNSQETKELQSANLLVP